MMLLLLLAPLLLTCGCQSWPFHQDAASEAVFLLTRANLTAFTLPQQIETAKSLLHSGQVRRNRLISGLFQALIGIEQMVDDSVTNNKYACGKEEIERLAKLHQAFTDATSYYSYDSIANSDRRLNKQVINFQVKYVQHCMEQFDTSVSEQLAKLDKSLVSSLDILMRVGLEAKLATDYIGQPLRGLISSAKEASSRRVISINDDVEYIDRWIDVLIMFHQQFSGTYKLGQSPKLEIKRAAVGGLRFSELFDRYIIETCSKLDNEPELISIIENINQIVQSVPPCSELTKTIEMRYKGGATIPLASATISLNICRRVKLMNKVDLIRQMIKRSN